jgi:predicted DNA-binding transcriptional regulator
MVSKDQGIGGAILAVCVIVILGFLALVLFPGQIASLLGLSILGDTLRLYTVVVLVSIAFIAILAIGAWIGWTMATTPPPKPIEEITTEIEDKKAEAAPEPPAPESAATEEKPAAKKKK